MIERRREPRAQADIPVLVWGTDSHARPFSQDAVAINLSVNGALLSGMDYEPRCGDLIGIAYEHRKARFRVIWARNCGAPHKVRIAVQKLAADVCPWNAFLSPLFVGTSSVDLPASPVVPHPASQGSNLVQIANVNRNGDIG
jgi:hypothetical protein